MQQYLFLCPTSYGLDSLAYEQAYPPDPPFRTSALSRGPTRMGAGRETSPFSGPPHHHAHAQLFLMHRPLLTMASTPFQYASPFHHRPRRRRSNPAGTLHPARGAIISGASTSQAGDARAVCSVSVSGPSTRHTTHQHRGCPDAIIEGNRPRTKRFFPLCHAAPPHFALR